MLSRPSCKFAGILVSVSEREKVRSDVEMPRIRSAPSVKELSQKLRSHFVAEGESDYFQFLLDSCSREKEPINDIK